MSEQQLQAHGLTTKDWRIAQQVMPSLKLIMDRLEQGLDPPAKTYVDPVIDTRYVKEWETLSLRRRPPSQDHTQLTGVPPARSPARMSGYCVPGPP